MQTDILASAVRTNDGVMNDQAGNAIGRCRVKGVYIVPAAGAGSVVLKDGSSGGATKVTINTIQMNRLDHVFPSQKGRE